MASRVLLAGPLGVVGLTLMLLHPTSAVPRPSPEPETWVAVGGPQPGTRLEAAQNQLLALDPRSGRQHAVNGSLSPLSRDWALYRIPGGAPMLLVSDARLAPETDALADALALLATPGRSGDGEAIAQVGYAIRLLQQDQDTRDDRVTLRESAANQAAEAQALLLTAQSSGVSRRAGFRSAAAERLEGALLGLLPPPPHTAESTLLLVDATQYNFGTLCVGESRVSDLITVTNKADFPLFIAPPDLSSFLVEAGVPVTLAPNAHTAVTFGFTASTGEGFVSETFRFHGVKEDYEAPSPEVTLQARDTFYKLDPPTLEFGDVKVGETKTLTTTLTNCSDTRRKVILDFLSPSGTREITLLDAREGKITLAPGESRTLTIQFAPRTGGSITEFLLLFNRKTDLDANNRLVISGRGARDVDFAPDRIDFGTVSRDAFHQQAFTLSNLSETPQSFTLDASGLPVRYFTVRLPPAGRRQPGQFPITLQPGAQQQVVLEFNANVKYRHRANLMLVGNQFSNGAQVIPVTVRAK